MYIFTIIYLEKQQWIEKESVVFLKLLSLILHVIKCRLVAEILL